MLFQLLSVGHKSRFIGHGEKLGLKNAVISTVTAFCSHGYPSQQEKLEASASSFSFAAIAETFRTTLSYALRIIWCYNKKNCG